MNSPTAFPKTHPNLVATTTTGPVQSLPTPGQRAVVAQISCDERLPSTIYAGDVIVIDCNQGSDMIDLGGYDVADALFYGNTIEINKGTENHFVIEYHNVRQAIFAGSISVDL